MRARRMAILWLLIAGTLLGILCVVLQEKARRDEFVREIEPERFIYQETTPVPALELDWIKYDLPLDDELQQYIEGLCREYALPASVVMAVIDQESGCDPDHMGDGGQSWGLMQIYSTEHTERCVRLGAWNLLDPRQNVRTGIDYLAELVDEGRGMEWALAAYNGGPAYADALEIAGVSSSYAFAVLTEAERLMNTAEVRLREVQA